MTLRSQLLPVAVLLALGCTPVFAGDLQQAYDLARQSDPVLAGSEAGKRIGDEGVVQSRAALLPQVSASGSLSSSHGSSTSVSSFPCSSGVCFGQNLGSSDTRNRNYTLNLQQNVFNRANWTGLAASRSRQSQADALYDDAANALITRVATAYFNVLSAIQDLASSRAQERALKRQLDQANVRLQVGLAPITDAQEAQAQYDIARAQTIGFETALSDAREALTEITGAPIDHLKGLSPDFVPSAPTPDDVQSWVKKAEDANPQIRAQQLAVDAANHDVDTARAGHWPTLGFDATYGKRAQWGSLGSNGLDFPATSTSRGPTYSLTLSVPLFSGFATQSGVRTALARRDAAADTLVQTRRSIERQVRNAYHATMGGLTEVAARKQALKSAHTALEATQTGLEVGTRTIVDVLINEQQLYSAERDYARARNNFIVNGLNLRQASGDIRADDLGAVNALLVNDAETALEPPADAAISAGDAPTDAAAASAPAADAAAKPAKLAKKHRRRHH